MEADLMTHALLGDLPGLSGKAQAFSLLVAACSLICSGFKWYWGGAWGEDEPIEICEYEHSLSPRATEAPPTATTPAPIPSSRAFTAGFGKHKHLELGLVINCIKITLATPASHMLIQRPRAIILGCIYILYTCPKVCGKRWSPHSSSLESVCQRCQDQIPDSRERNVFSENQGQDRVQGPFQGKG